MRFVFLAAAVAISGASSASFDLILVADAGQRVIHRYDGDSGTYLGNFGGGNFVNIRGLAVDKTTSTVYVTHDGGYSTWDYNTGAFKLSSDIVGPNVNDISLTNDNRILFASSTTSATALRRSNSLAPNASVTNYTTTGAFGPFTTAFQGGDGRYYSVNSAVGEVSRWASNTALSEAVLTYTGLSGTTKGDNRGDEFVALSANGRANRLLVNSPGVFLGDALFTPFTSSVEFAFGHPSEGWGLGTNASGTRLQRYMRTLGGVGNTYDPFGTGRTLTQVQTPVALAVVTAPEPGTMLALGAGAAMLLRRRRRR